MKTNATKERRRGSTATEVGKSPDWSDTPDTSVHPVRAVQGTDNLRPNDLRFAGTCGCKCGAHRQHLVFRFLWYNPSAKGTAAARALHLTRSNVYEAVWRLRKKDLTRTCPECFRPSLSGGACLNCGFEPFEPVPPSDVVPGSQHPTNHLHPGNMLGSVTDYNEVAKAYGLSNWGFVLKRKVDRQVETPLLDAVRSDVANCLDGGASPEVMEEAGRLAVKEWREFQAGYPKMARSKLARRQLAERVLARLRLVHPGLNLRVLEGDGHG